MMTPNSGPRALRDANAGDRPSKLDLDRYATGELSELEQRRIDASLDDAARAHLAAVQEAKRHVPRFDAAAIRARAARIAPDPVRAPPRVPKASNTGWFAVTLLAAAAVLGLAIFSMQEDSSTRMPFGHATGEGPDVRVKIGDSLQVFQLQGQKLYAYDGAPVGADDVLGFKVVATGHAGVVLLSVDGNGVVDVFYPEDGDEPEPISGDGTVALPGTVRLDAAPGPEVFVAVFDRKVSEARTELEHTWQAGGPEAVLEWAEKAPGVDAVEVHRR